MEPPRIENNFSPSFLCPISAFSASSARDSLTPRWAEHVKSGLLLRRPLSSDSRLQRLWRGIFPGQQCAEARIQALTTRALASRPYTSARATWLVSTSGFVARRRHKIRGTWGEKSASNVSKDLKSGAKNGLPLLHTAIHHG